MKKIAIIFLFITYCLTSFGQVKTDSVEVRIFKKRRANLSVDTTTNIKTRWGLFGVGNTFYAGKNGFKLANNGTPGTGDDAFAIKVAQSFNINIHLYRQRINLHKHKLNLVHGLAYDFHKYHFKYGTKLWPGEPNVTYTQDTVTNFRVNSLKTSFVMLPVLLNFESNPGNTRRSFRFSAGGYASILLYAKTKRNSKETDRVRIVDNFNLNQFRYGLRGEVGYSNLNLYFSWSLNTLFEKGESPELHPLSIGIVLIPF